VKLDRPWGTYNVEAFDDAAEERSTVEGMMLVV
jgi:hypothetical protein